MYTPENSALPVNFVQSITIDNQDNIRCGAFGGYAVYDGTHWTVDHTSFQEESVFAIEQSSDGKIWMGTGDGIYINN